MDHHALFNENSDVYERARPSYPPTLYQHLADLCAKRSRVWDCACGNGQAAISLAQLFEHVDATDVSTNQIEHSKQADNIDYRVSPAETTDFAPASFDLICVAQALHWFDYERFWPEVKRVLKPGGVFSAWGYNWPVWGDDLETVISESYLEIIEPYFAPHNKLLWNHYQDLEFPFNSIERPTLRMQIEWNLDQLFDMLRSVSAARLCIEERGEDFFQTAYRKAKEHWGDPADRRVFEFDTVWVVAR